MTRTRATAIGFVAVLLWALLALFTVGTAPTPPLLLNAICFTIGGTIGLIWTMRNGGFSVLRAVSWKVYVFGTLGLFGYHALYFSALRLAPAAEAGLIAYLWPLLIVLFSGLLPGEHLKAGHLIGALCGFFGAALIIQGGGNGFNAEALPGYVLALLCALTWSGYSVFSRRLGDAPTETVAVFCIATAILSAITHVAFEDTVWPVGAMGWASAIALGLGPVGLAFYVWDIGVKRGDIQLLGTASYAAPLLSTLVLVAVGIADPSWLLGAATLLITGGAVIAARASLKS
ncbi:aromatic amino acid exporter YddG [Shimia thalassica]|uniref:aromatic amino acid exporter YddG n=1 Tax=Shimia thalassica TaxID=1715693 RepID=UPI0026E322F1|nr:EamA family transporter [Shimia thalassica]MDO6484727.1 EamA family transporter [Shimia thalassica]